jgi:transcription initiation factor TFIIIB Brf1 subunit/transcription initiation factor TFIIB
MCKNWLSKPKVPLPLRGQCSITLAFLAYSIEDHHKSIQYVQQALQYYEKYCKELPLDDEVVGLRSRCQDFVQNAKEPEKESGKGGEKEGLDALINMYLLSELAKMSTKYALREKIERVVAQEERLERPSTTRGEAPISVLELPRP